MKTSLKYKVMLIILFMIVFIPNIAKAISIYEINAHQWGTLYPGASFWQTDNVSQFTSYFRALGKSDAWFQNPNSEPGSMHLPSFGSCAQCNAWRAEGGNFLRNVYNTAERRIYSGAFPMIRNIMEYEEGGIATHLYCVEHSASLSDDFWHIYQNVAYMRIDGNYLTQVSKIGQADIYPNEYSQYNGVLAYLGYATPETGFNGLNEYGDRKYGGYGKIKADATTGTPLYSYTDSQKVMWAHMNYWYETVGTKYGIDYSDEKNNDYNYLLTQNDPNSLYGKASQYASNVGNTTSTTQVNVKDNTNKNNISVNYYTDNGEQWIKVGPFNWSYNGNLNSVTVTGNTGVISDAKFYDSNATTQINANQISSGKNFYIGVKSDLNLNTITKIEGNISLPDVITADIWIFKGDAAQINLSTMLNQPDHASSSPDKLLQKIMLIKPELVQVQGNIATDTIPLTIDFSVLKVDENNNQITLPNVGFKFYNKEVGKYLKENGTSMQYVDTVEEATDFVTDENGRIELNNVLVGTYIAYETVNPHYGYVVDGSGKEIIPSNGQEILLPNQKQTGNLTIQKQDADNQSIRLQGVQFRLSVENTNNPIPGFMEGRGDINLDGILDQQDIDLLNSYLAGRVNLNADQMTMANVNGDRIVNTDDLNLLRRKIENMEYVVGLQEDENGNLVPIGTAKGTIHFDSMTTTKNANEATIFETDEQGFIKIYNILTGKYVIQETSVGNNFGYDLDPNFISWVITNSDGAQSTVNSSTAAAVTVVRQTSTDTSDSSAEQATGGSDQITVNNRRKYIKIRGYAWEEKTDGKNSTKDYIWNEGTEDKRLQYIPVKLIDEFGNVLAQTVTDANGEYVFGNYDENANATKIEIDDLVASYIEFEYNGMCYQSIPTNVDFIRYNGSNTNTYTNENRNTATDEASRNEFNNNYAIITTGNQENTADTKYNTSAGGNESYDIRYHYDATIHESNVIYGDDVRYGYEGQTYPIAQVAPQYAIKAVTQQQPYNALCTQLTAEDIRKQSVEEIAGLNLGVEERIMPDLLLIEDMEKVDMSLQVSEDENYTHTYYYNQRFEDPANYAGGEQINASVKFANKYIENSYSRDVYSSDVKYNQQPGKEGALQVYITYRIRVVNESSTVHTKLNSFANYYDSRYSVVSVKDYAGRDVRYLPDGSYNSSATELNKIMITPEAGNYPIIPAGQSREYTITYQLNNDAINSLLNETLTLESVTEVTSYSSYSDEAGQNVYAGIDQDSAVDTTEPSVIEENGNRKISIVDTLEDDTDKAPSLIINLKEGRIIKGTVWEDSAIEDLLNNEGYDKERKGDGIYNNENVVKDVTVELLTVQSDGTYALADLYQIKGNVWDPEEKVPATMNTNDKGEYEFSGVIPSRYVIRYTYGNNSIIVSPSGEQIKNVEVDKYKSTIYRGGNVEDENIYWYREETGSEATRYSDAKDNDEFIQARITPQDNITYETVVAENQLTEIQADTAQFLVSLDYDINQPGYTMYTERENGNGLKFIFDNVDFGIIERPKQSLELEKQVSNITITLANGSTLISGDPRTDHLQGVRVLDNDEVYIEFDNEIIQGSTLRLSYEISVDNRNCEIDYDDENYYIYGHVPANHANYKIATVVDMYDYLPEELMLQQTDGNNWERIDLGENPEEIRDKILADPIYETVKDYQNVVHLVNPIFENMEPGQRVVDNSLVVSKLLSVATDDLTYENDIEIVKLKGRKTYDSIPGNYDPTTNESYEPGTDTYGGDELDDDYVPVTITPPYGENRTYWMLGIIGITALIIIGVGVVIIKKKVL